MTNKNTDISTGLSWLGTVLQYIREYGFFNIIKSLILLMLLNMTIKICYDPTSIFDKYIEYQKEKHKLDLTTRAIYDSKLKRLLPPMMYKYRADRIWLIQYHNGVMDWLHGTMRFEVCNEGVESIKRQYNNFNLTWLDIPFYLKEHEIFVGDINELFKIDKTLGIQFHKNGVKYLACIIIRDNNRYPIGVLGVTWSEVPINSELTNLKLRHWLLEDRSEIKYLMN